MSRALAVRRHVHETNILNYAASGNLDGLDTYLNNQPDGSFGNLTTLVDESGRTALHYAAEFNHVRIVDFLLRLNANKEARDKFGWTPLHYAASKGYIEAVKSLIREAGSKRSIPDDNGFTALHEAARNGHLECVIELVKIGPDLIADRNAVSVHGSTPLHLAAYHKHLAVCKFLVSQRADFTLKNNDGKMPLDVAQGVEVRGFFLALERQKDTYPCCCGICKCKKIFKTQEDAVNRTNTLTTF